MEFHCVLEDCSMEEVVVTEEVVETNNGYEADVDDIDDGYEEEEEEWMFGDEEWLVSDPFLCEMDQEVYSWLYEEAFRPNVSSTPVRPTTPPPPSIFQPFTDMDTLKSWYQPDSATPPPTPSRKHKLYEDDDDEDDEPIMRHVRRRLV
ncbi:hypothetical protein SNE40_020773 [Patella caerulea]|uniref:Uncharacterized protein n=1 Tax=Patella caerulea TaxID=87958 RepID=A0AAN8J4X7_PATCE